MKTIDELWIALGTKGSEDLTDEEIAGILNNTREFLDRQRRVSYLSFSQLEEIPECRRRIRQLDNLSNEELVARKRVLLEERDRLGTGCDKGPSFTVCNMELNHIEKILVGKAIPAMVDLLGG